MQTICRFEYPLRNTQLLKGGWHTPGMQKKLLTLSVKTWRKYPFDAFQTDKDDDTTADTADTDEAGFAQDVARKKELCSNLTRRRREQEFRPPNTVLEENFMYN